MIFFNKKDTINFMVRFFILGLVVGPIFACSNWNCLGLNCFSACTTGEYYTLMSVSFVGFPILFILGYFFPITLPKNKVDGFSAKTIFLNLLLPVCLFASSIFFGIWAGKTLAELLMNVI